MNPEAFGPLKGSRQLVYLGVMSHVSFPASLSQQENGYQLQKHTYPSMFQSILPQILSQPSSGFPVGFPFKQTPPGSLAPKKKRAPELQLAGWQAWSTRTGASASPRCTTPSWCSWRPSRAPASSFSSGTFWPFWGAPVNGKPPFTRKGAAGGAAQPAFGRLPFFWRGKKGTCEVWLAWQKEEILDASSMWFPGKRKGDRSPKLEVPRPNLPQRLAHYVGWLYGSSGWIF